MMVKGKVRNQQIAEEAADWAVMLDYGELCADEKSRLAHWLLESPRHVEELFIAASFVSALEDVDPEKSRSVDELLKATPAEVVSIVREDASDASDALDEVDEAVEAESWERSSYKSSRWVPLAIAASLLVALLSVTVLSGIHTQIIGDTDVPDSQSSSIVADIGELKKVILDDGSVIHVNTQSEVVVQFDDDARIVELVRGEALFEVAHDPNRPFRVSAGGAIAEAIGTTFNVYRDAKHTSVAVIEGKVAFEGSQKQLKYADTKIGRSKDGRLLLTAGQKADMSQQTRWVEITSINTTAASAWSGGQLVFENERLDKIVSEFNRYNRTNLVVADKDLATMRLSGVFDADQPETLIETLTVLRGVKADRTDPGVIRLEK